MIIIFCPQVTYDFMYLQGMPDINRDDPKRLLDSLHVSSLVCPSLAYTAVMNTDFYVVISFTDDG